MMVGLSIVLEGYRDITTTTSKKKIPFHQASMIKSPSPPSSADNSFTRGSNPFSYSNSNCRNGGGFLDQCFLCKQKLLPGKDIYMYKGDRAFCSEECRCRQIFMDEEEYFMPNKTPHDRHLHCSVAATSSSSSRTSSSSSSARRKGANKNQANGFAY